MCVLLSTGIQLAMKLGKEWIILVLGPRLVNIFMREVSNSHSVKDDFVSFVKIVLYTNSVLTLYA